MIIEQKRKFELESFPVQTPILTRYRLSYTRTTVEGKRSSPKLSVLELALQGFLEQLLDSSYSRFLRENVLRCEV